MRFAPTLMILALATAPAFAHEDEMQGSGSGKMSGMDGKAMEEMMAGNPYGQAEMDMHMKMMAAKQGDASEMWIRKMIEHHRGAIAMSRVAMRDAQDSDVRQMAEMDIAKQDKDIAELQKWLSKNGKSAQ